jgi:hypothetical protein
MSFIVWEVLFERMLSCVAEAAREGLPAPWLSWSSFSTISSLIFLNLHNSGWLSGEEDLVVFGWLSTKASTHPWSKGLEWACTPIGWFA